MGSRKVVTSAVIVSPPKESWNPIQDIRMKHDKAYSRWMPHINLLYPFYPESQFQAILPKVREALASVKPFKVTFDSFDFFEHGASSCTLFLNPTVQPPNALIDLQAALYRAFPECDEQSTKSHEGFHAHLTVGQFKGKALTQRKKVELSRSWKPIEWTVDHVQLISRTVSGPFQVSHTVPLGVNVSAAAPARVSAVPAAASAPKPAIPTQQRTPEASLPRQAAPPRQCTGPKDPPKPGNAEEIVVERLSQWIAYNAALPKSSLPKTKAKLRSAIKPMCSVKTTYLDVDDVIKQLVEGGYIRFDGDKVKFLKKQAGERDRLSTNTFVARESYRLANDAHKEPEKIVMARCREWVEAPSNTPTTREALKNSLQQLCIMREEVEGDKAVKLLESRGLIVIDNDDKVTYP